MSNSSDKINVIMFQKYIAPYRVNLFNALSEYPNINLLLAYYGKKEKRRKWTEYPGIKFKEHNCKVLSLKLSYEKNLNLPFIIAPYLFRHKPDVVICFSDIAGFFLLFARMFLKFKIVVWSEAISDSEKDISFLKKKWRKIFFKKTDCFLLPGINAVNYIKEISGDKKYFIAPNTVDNIFEIGENELKKYDKPDTIKLIFAGSLIKRKGIDILQDSMEILSKKNLKRKYKVYIIGEGEEEKRKIENVEYLGFKQLSEFSEYIKQSHITIVPSRKDINPLIMIEALKSGNIIVCSKDVGNYPEIVGENGIVLKSLDAESLSSALELLINSTDEKLYEMGMAGWKKGKLFSHTKSAESFKAAIEFVNLQNKK